MISKTSSENDGRNPVRFTSFCGVHWGRPLWSGLKRGALGGPQGSPEGPLRRGRVVEVVQLPQLVQLQQDGVGRRGRGPHGVTNKQM